MIPQYIKSPYTAEQLRASAGRISSYTQVNGTWIINGKKAMDKSGRIFLSFIKNSNYRELNYLRGLLLRGRTHSDGTPLRTGFEKLNRPFRMDKAGAFNPNNEDDAFLSLAKKGEVWALQRLITRTDIVSPTRKISLMKKAEEVKRAIDAKATYGNANQAAAESTDAMFDAAKNGAGHLTGTVKMKTKPTGEKCQTRETVPADPYKSDLMALPKVEREQLLTGGWSEKDSDIDGEPKTAVRDSVGNPRAVGNANAESDPPNLPRHQRGVWGRAWAWITGGN